MTQTLNEKMEKFAKFNKIILKSGKFLHRIHVERKEILDEFIRDREGKRDHSVHAIKELKRIIRNEKKFIEQILSVQSFISSIEHFSTISGSEWIVSEARTGVPQARASKATIG